MAEPINLSFDPVDAARRAWPTHFGDEAPATAMAAATSIMRAQQLLLAAFDAAVAPYGLTFARYEVLVLLDFSRSGALPMSKVGERLMVHPTSATNAVQRLAAAGYVERCPNPRDGRGTLAVITDAGRTAMREATEALHALDFGLGELTQDQQEQLVGLLRPVRVGAGDFVES